MTLTTLLIGVAIAAGLFTGLVGLVLKRQKNWLMTYVQSFCGILFLFSGYVKAVDPLGTAYKMEQYFAEFESTFADTAFSFLAPLFPWLSSMAIGFSVFMIVFEIVLGLMLLMGSKPKLTAWLFFGLVAFFTVLTGFTYLTGYVPNDVNFFQFGSWGPYVKTNMKVTDCGCFGDFLVLEPKTSFLKDVFLLAPSIYFIWRTKDMHQIFTPKVRNIVLGVATAGLLLMCLSNYSWDIPRQDFRPFKVGTDVAAVKAFEEAEMSKVQVYAYRLTNKTSGKSVELPYADFLKQFKDYPKAEWEYEQLKTEPSIKPSKISEYSITDADGLELADSLLGMKGYSMMIVSYKLKGEGRSEKVTKKIPIYVQDTITTASGEQSIVRKLDREENQEFTETTFDWDSRFAKIYSSIVNPMMASAESSGLNVYGVAGGAGNDKIESFRHHTQAAYPIYEADDILLKTIVRSNPGIVLWKDGAVVKKWHYKKLPTWEEIKAEYIQ